MRIIKATRRPVKKNVGCAGKTYVLESKQALPYGRRLAPRKGGDAYAPLRLLVDRVSCDDLHRSVKIMSVPA